LLRYRLKARYALVFEDLNGIGLENLKAISHPLRLLTQGEGSTEHGKAERNPLLIFDNNLIGKGKYQLPVRA
jgi:hypothetical protein